MSDTIVAENLGRKIDWDELDTQKFADEEVLVTELLRQLPLGDAGRTQAVRRGREIVTAARLQTRHKGLIESFLEEFGLSNQEGLSLMCLAEALLRVPDAETRDDLIAERIRSGNWTSHLGQSDSWLVNASTWGLVLTGRVIGPTRSAQSGPKTFVQGLVRESGEPVIRAAMMRAMKIMGEEFVLGRSVKAALKRGRKMVRDGDAANFSFDMLGEGARTMSDAERYFEAYLDAIDTVGSENDASLPPERANGVSVKLSALHPRYEAVKEARVFAELYPRLLAVAERAASYGINLCLDAEEADRLVISLKLLDRLAREPSLGSWTGLGLAVQAYQKRAVTVVGTLKRLADASGRRLMVRLVKGAYWDTEIKHAQVEGHEDFPVFTTRAATDLNYLICAERLMKASPALYPQFATHNAHTFAAIEHMAKREGVTDFEFQRLHGMGEALYEAAGAGGRVRVYAPVGVHKDLLPYLVRRLLENGANTSFVNTFLDADVPVEDVVDDPIASLEAGAKRHARIVKPLNMFAPERSNSSGLDLTQKAVRDDLSAAIKSIDGGKPLRAGPVVMGRMNTAEGDPLYQPHDLSRSLGTWREASGDEISAALSSAKAAQPEWDAMGGAARGEILRSMADALENRTHYLVGLMARETGKTLGDGIAEVREAVDFLRYYALQAEKRFDRPTRLPGPTGETNHLSLHGRGVFACISPWNFPLAIFTGQLAAALGAGNTVVAKPAEQSPFIAGEAVHLFQGAGLPADVLHLLPGRGETVGAALISDVRIAGVAFTGGTKTAQLINRALAQRDGPIIPLIAETGGLNAMFVDTTALREQVVDDVVVSAFGSAGQRCSALRLVFLPEDTADDLINGLSGAMDELAIGDPGLPDTDVGPLIDAEAREHLEQHLEALRHTEGAKIIKQVSPGVIGDRGFGFGPALVEIDDLDILEEEKFGPILHVMRYDPDRLGDVSQPLAAKGYGLTLGVHSRLSAFADEVRAAVPVGNTYVNRSMTGAVVGVQPFGGEGLSGTGPKAGGPNYMLRFATERTMTVNITAQGGDPELLNL